MSEPETKSKPNPKNKSKSKKKSKTQLISGNEYSDLQISLNSTTKPRKYIISVVSIISTYKSPILKALHQYLPYSVYIKNDIDDPTDTLFEKAKKELEREDVQCVILKKNNHRGRQRKFMFEQLEPLKSNYDVKHIVLDFVGDQRELNTTEFRNMLFTRILKQDQTEVVNPIDLKLSEIESFVLNFTSEYTSLRLAKQKELFDLIITLDFKKPSVYHSLMLIVQKLRSQCKDLILNVTDKEISQYSTPFDQKIKKDQKEIKEQGVVSMTGYVYANEHAKEDNKPIRYVIIPVTVDLTGYDSFNEVLHDAVFPDNSSIISIAMPRELKINLEEALKTKEVVMLNVTNSLVSERNHLRTVLRTIKESYRLRAIWLNYVPYISQEDQEDEADTKQLSFFKQCIRSYKKAHPGLTPEENDKVVQKLFKSAKLFEQISDEELDTLSHYYIDMCQDTKSDLKLYLQTFVDEIVHVYPKLIPNFEKWFDDVVVADVINSKIEQLRRNSK